MIIELSTNKHDKPPNDEHPCNSSPTIEMGIPFDLPLSKFLEIRHDFIVLLKPNDKGNLRRFLADKFTRWFGPV